MNLEIFLVVFGFLLLTCLFANKLSYKAGIPSLLVFLAIGMLAGQDGLGGIAFQDAQISNYIGSIALTFILFSGGLNTNWKFVRPVLFRGAILSTAGVALTALFLFLCTRYIFGLSRDISLLLGVILSSTDAPAVFTALRSSRLHLKDAKLQALLEFESGSNDPMAVILSMGVIGVLTTERFSLSTAIIDFSLQMGLGIFCGYLFGRMFLYLLQHYDFTHRGLYPVLGISIVFLMFSITQMIGGNGFLALYLGGILLGNKSYRYRKVLIEFHDSLAWTMQIAMFLTLGLLVNPSELKYVFFLSLGISFCLMFLARPLAVWFCLIGGGYTVREQTFAFWAGLKGAVPIILATYPLMIKYPQAQFLFNLIFFLVIISVFIQGKTLSPLAKKLDLTDAAPSDADNNEPEFNVDLKDATENTAAFFAEIKDELNGLFVKALHRREDKDKQPESDSPKE